MSSLRTSPTPAGAVELQRWVLVRGEELRLLRTDLRRALHTHRLVGPGLPDELPDHVLLVATELAGNALRHGLPPALVRLLRADGRFILDVADRGVDSAPQLAEAGYADDGGRGLRIVRKVVLEVCWYVTGETKHVWASFPLSLT